MYGPEVTAEHFFQQQLANWLQQNIQFGGNNGGNNQNVQHMQVPNQVPLPAHVENNLAQLLQMLEEAPLYNFQYMLAE
jgi:hypothetical protein